MVFAYYGGAVSIGVDVDDGTDWGEVNQLLDAIAVPPAPGAPSTRREPNGALTGDGDRTVTVGCQGGGTGYGASADLDRRCVQR